MPMGLRCLLSSLPSRYKVLIFPGLNGACFYAMIRFKSVMKKRRPKLKIRIKRANHNDISLFWDFFSNSVKSQFPVYSEKAKNYYLKKDYTKNNIRKWLKHRNITLLLAVCDKAIVGYLMASYPFGGVPYISWIAVEETLHGMGIGTKLLKRYETIAKRRGIHKIHLWTDKRNVRFYKKRGYILVGHIPQNFFGADDWLFYKTLQSPQ